MGFLISNGHCIHVIEFFGGLGKFPFTQNEATWFESSKNPKNLGFDAKSSHRRLQIARGQYQISHKRGQHQSKTYPLQKNQGFDSKGFEFQSWIAMVLVQISIGQCQGAKGKLQGARGRGFQTRYTENHVKPYQIQSKTIDLDSQDFDFQSWFAMVRL